MVLKKHKKHRGLMLYVPNDILHNEQAAVHLAYPGS